METNDLMSKIAQNLENSSQPEEGDNNTNENENTDFLTENDIIETNENKSDDALSEITEPVKPLISDEIELIVNGEKLTANLDEIKALAQIAIANDVKLEESKAKVAELNAKLAEVDKFKVEYVKEVENKIVNSLTTMKQADLMNLLKNLRSDYDVLVEELMIDKLNYENMSPVEKELKKKESELQKYEREMLNIKKQREEEIYNRQVASYAASFEKEIPIALENVGFDSSNSVVREKFIQFYMAAADKLGDKIDNVPVKQVAEYFRDRMKQEIEKVGGDITKFMKLNTTPTVKKEEVVKPVVKTKKSVSDSELLNYVKRISKSRH